MDIAFHRRAQRLLDGAAPASIDHDMLVAILNHRPRPAESGGGDGVTDEGRAAPASRDDYPIVDLLLEGARSPASLRAQGGSFSRAEAGRRVNIL